MSQYDPASYWSRRLGDDFSLAGVGNRMLGLPFNRAMYAQRRRTVRRAVRAVGIEPNGARVLELGVGTGYFVPVWKSLGVSDLVGVDITSVAVERLTQQHPAYHFVQADLTAHLPVEPASFDIVTAFEVLLHITDDAAFEHALRNAAVAARDDAHLLITDLFLDRGAALPMSAHNVVRTLEQYSQALTATGWTPVRRFPVFVSMAPAYDLPPGRPQSLATRWWRWLQASLRDRPERGRLLGPTLGTFDALASRILRDGPSTELLVARRT